MRQRRAARDELPRTASQLPMIALLGVLALAAGLGLRAARTM
jgi:LPXTG-motif cell wall-anchored protein